MTSPKTTSPHRRHSPARTRLHIRLDARERLEIDQAVKANGFLSPAPLLLSLIRQQARETEQTGTLHAHMQAVVQAAVTAAIGNLTDRLAADLSTLSAAIDERPTKSQMNAFLVHFRAQVTS